MKTKNAYRKQVFNFIEKRLTNQNTVVGIFLEKFIIINFIKGIARY